MNSSQRFARQRACNFLPCWDGGVGIASSGGGQTLQKGGSGMHVNPPSFLGTFCTFLCRVVFITTGKYINRAVGNIFLLHSHLWGCYSPPQHCYSPSEFLRTSPRP
eukprot:Hpha_TRINITY_DN15329_c4_g2::TRINITY_DN15329_c4_g2_i1::g.89456::m.89456